MAYNSNCKEQIRTERRDMKRRDLIEKMERAGFRLLRNGHDHDVYSRGSDIELVPRHREINEKLAKGIIKKWGLK